MKISDARNQNIKRDRGRNAHLPAKPATGSASGGLYQKLTVAGNAVGQ